MRIAVVAPSCRLAPEAAERVRALAGTRAEVVVHPQCFLSDGHFAGPDTARAAAFLEAVEDPSVDAVWFARGGYGSNRILEAVTPRLSAVARAKRYLGYSDGGFLLSALYRAGCSVAHGPMVQDVLREGGEAAVCRSLAWLIDHDPAALEPSIAPGQRTAAFNLTVLAHLVGTPWQPELEGHVLMLEEVSEAMYRIDRALFHVTSNPEVRKVAGVRLGRCSAIPENDPDFIHDEVTVARAWCERAGIAWLGRADIGHDADNRVVPFGALAR
jgi:muramoyltetrapeptide carboxypeptidase